MVTAGNETTLYGSEPAKALRRDRRARHGAGHRRGRWTTRAGRSVPSGRSRGAGPRARADPEGRGDHRRQPAQCLAQSRQRAGGAPHRARPLSDSLSALGAGADSASRWCTIATITRAPIRRCSTPISMPRWRASCSAPRTSCALAGYRATAADRPQQRRQRPRRQDRGSQHAAFRPGGRGAAAPPSCSRWLGLDHVVSADMGGTSFDIGVVLNRQRHRSKRRSANRGHADRNARSSRSHRSALGGGSIASGGGNDLKVGPESAGSAPGPACYGKGGTEPDRHRRQPAARLHRSG